MRTITRELTFYHISYLLASNVVKSEHEYYDGGYVEEEVDFGRNHVVKAIA